MTSTDTSNATANETDTDTPWEPPLAGTDVTQVLGSLDRMRWTFRWKAADLDAAGLNTTVGPSTLTLGGLLKHLAAQEDYLTTVKLHGEPLDGYWAEHGWDGSDDWEFTSAADDTPEQLYALYDAAVARSRHCVRGRGSSSRTAPASPSSRIAAACEATSSRGSS